MNITETLSQFFPVARTQLTALQLHVESCPASWRQSLQKAIDQGAFLKVEFGMGGYGAIEARLLLVNGKNGDLIEVAVADRGHV